MGATSPQRGRAIGRAKNPEKAKAHIKRRAKALGAKSWKDAAFDSGSQRRKAMRQFVVDGITLSHSPGNPRWPFGRHDRLQIAQRR
jgi:hypothetical protein